MYLETALQLTRMYTDACSFLKKQSSEYSLLLQNYLKNSESIRKIKNDLLWIPVSIYIANSDFTLCSIYFFFFGMTTNLPVAYSNSRPWKITSNQFLVHHCWQWHWAAYLAFFYFLFNFLNNSCIQNLQVTRWARQSRDRMCLQPGNNFLNFLSSK